MSTWLGVLVCLLGADPETTAQVSRLEGHDVSIDVSGHGYTIEDIAGEGKPLVGIVRRRERQLWLVTPTGGSYRIAGPLARPRIAGPDYKVWILGSIAGEVLTARRLGILAAPGRFTAPEQVRTPR